ncbi:MAG: ATP-dependent Clp protease adaptor ClpS [Bdellovibrionota bacterium]
MAEGDTGTISKEKVKTKTPKKYKVVLLNDDYTTMDFVVKVLETVFNMKPAEAVQVMLQVHNKGRGMCGIFTRQIAEAKIAQVHDLAVANGYP